MNGKQNSKIKEPFIHVEAKIILQEQVPQTELEMYLYHLEAVSKAMVLHMNIFRGKEDMFKNTLNGLWEDLTANREKADKVQSLLKLYKMTNEN